MPRDSRTSSARFPTTHVSAVMALGSDDEALRARSFATLVLGYYKPVYKLVRIKWRKSAEEAEDVTQDFFAEVLGNGLLSGYDPAKARFRTYVRVCLDGFVAKRRRAEKRKKRGGHLVFQSLDFPSAEAEIAAFGLPAESEIDAYFDREWARHVFGTAVDALRAAYGAIGETIRFQVFEHYEIVGQRGEKPTYAEVGRKLGISATQVNNFLHRARRDLQRLVVETLRELTPNVAELRSEARALLGVELDESGHLPEPEQPARRREKAP